MKNRIILFVSLLVLGLNLTSCGDDDRPSTSGDIVAKWEWYKVGDKDDGSEYLELYEHQVGCTKDNVEFSSNGNYIDSSYFDGCESDSYSGTYTKSGNVLTVNDGFDLTTYTIKELSSSTLKVYETYSEDGETYTDIIIFKRVN
jgi:Lipocalin-like domain